MWTGSLPQRRHRDVRGRGFDVLALVAAFTLVILGALNLYAAASWSLAVRQLVAVAAGLVLLVLMRRVHVERLAVLGWACYGLSIVLLLAVSLFGVERYGAKRWLAIGELTFQPSELAKLGLLLLLANVLGSNRPAWRRFLLAVVLAVVPIGFTLLQPDLSTAMLLTAMTAGLLILSRIPPRFLLPLFGSVVLVAPLAVRMLRPHQLARLQAYLAGSESTEGPGYAIRQAHIALASGGLFGQARDPLHRLRAEYLPGREHDLTLASLVQQWGLVAGASAVLAIVVLVWWVALASRVARTRRGMLTCAGFAVLLGAEAVVSLGGNLGALPLAGIPFPLVSQGGTAALVHLAALGVVLGVRRDGVRRRLWALPRWHNPRPRLVRFAALGVSGLLAGLSAYGWHLQEVRGESLRRAGETQMTRCVRIPAPRGIITDRHGVPLAVNAAQNQIVVIPALLRRPDDLRRLAALVGQPVDQLRRTLAAAGTRLSTRVAVVPADTGSRVSAARIPGVVVAPDPRRVYPHGAMLAPLLGFVGVATPQDESRWPNLPLGGIVGRAGIEQQYDPILRGIDGYQCVYVDPLGVPVTLGPRQAPVPGAALRLSIDLGLQREITKTLADALAGRIGERRGHLGGVVAMDPRTGQVLAMASLPAYDNNLYGPPVDARALRKAVATPGSPMLQHVTQVVGPPGSTFKLVVAAADMVYPVLPPDKAIPTGASYTFGGHTFGNWRGFGPQNLVQAIAWSNDVYFYKLAYALGPDRIHQVGSALGVGRPTGIDLPGESAGYFGTPQSVRAAGGVWYPGSSVILGIGQGYITTTPLQAARWTAAVATGSLVTPRLGLAFSTADGTTTALPAPPAQPLPFGDALGPVREGMRQAVSGGTAAVLSDLPVAAGAKTGTSENPSNPGGAPDAWFTAVAPMDRPAVVMTSYIRGGGQGSRTSGPVVKRALQYFLAHQTQILKVSPPRTPSAGTPGSDSGRPPPPRR
ncbi:FtsW/RodA/SpoVE family cell cycle protein [Carbonactinospora thermoautotrophica]|uniref:FtsW/RodA/SpoVE family cell cycle protein n=1 Tax=Carbonactinospora thermoautotrophica TaxID=1469144 RepID=UPI00226E4820|nr:FtsW/RodA/SpoVE family cell cycle protein [Carbonactinospora thermoautotrophica]